MPEDYQDQDKTQTHIVLTEGTLIGNYRIVRKIGAGGMGEVYLAEDTQLQRKIAIKTLSPLLMADDDGKARFRREALAAAALNHPNIITVHEIGQFQGRLFIAMEYVEGESLSEVIGRDEMPFTTIVDIATQIIEGLSAAHKAGVIHRDIKPSNIMISREGRIKIVDFGLAKRTQDDNLTQAGSTIGTFAYMSPEQLQGEDVDHRSDLFSVGTVFYELSTGRRPFPGTHFTEITRNIVDHAPLPPEDFRSDMPFEFVHVLSKCFEKNPRLRYQNADEIRADLLRVRRELDGGADPMSTAAKAMAIERQGKRGKEDARIVIPALPPLPPRKSLLALCVAGVLAFVCLILWPPADLWTLKSVALDSAGAEKIARQFLENMGFGMFGLSYYTSSSTENELQDIINYQKLPLSQRRRLSDFRPVFQYLTVAAGADRHQRYYVSTNSDGRVFAFKQIMHPDLITDSISADSAGIIAGHYLKSALGLNPDEFTSQTLMESVIDGRHIRQYRWQKDDSLPGGAAAYANVWLAGPLLVQAFPTIEFPQTLTQTIEDEENWMVIIGFSLLAISLMITIVICLRNRWFAMPGIRLFVILAAAVLLFYIFVSDFWRATLVEQGGGDVFQGVMLGLLLLVPVFTVLLCACWGVIYGALKYTRPEILTGLSGLLKGRIPNAVWARSAVVGMSIGAVAALIFEYCPQLLSSVIGAPLEPPIVFGNITSISYQLSEITFGVIIFPLLLGAGMAAFTVLQREIHLGKWVWPIFIAIGTMLGGFFGGALYPETVHYIAMAIVVSLFFVSAVRFGLLAGSIVWFSARYIEMIVQLLNGSRLSFQFMGAFYLALWFTLLALSFYHILKAPRESLAAASK